MEPGGDKETRSPRRKESTASAASGASRKAVSFGTFGDPDGLPDEEVHLLHTASVESEPEVTKPSKSTTDWEEKRLGRFDTTDTFGEDDPDLEAFGEETPQNGRSSHIYHGGLKFEAQSASMTMSETTTLNENKSRIIYSDMQPRVVVTKHTLVASVFGEGSRIEHAIYVMGARGVVSTSVLWIMWYIGMLAGLLVVARLLPLYLIWASLLMLPLPLVTISLFMVDLIQEIVKSMDVWVIYILQLAWFLDGIYYCKMDIRSVFWFSFLPTMIAAGFVDAYPSKWRAFFAKLYFIGLILMLVVWNFMLFFQWKVFGDMTSKNSLGFFAAITHHLSDQVTLFVFFCRHLWCSVYSADHYVMIKAEVVTGRQVTCQKTGSKVVRRVSYFPQQRRANTLSSHLDQWASAGTESSREVRASILEAKSAPNLAG